MKPTAREMAALVDLRSMLEATTVPERLADALVAAAPPLWLSSDRADALASDLALCHPPLAAGEVRARVVGTGDGPWRLTVVARDRPGLLADTTTALAAEAFSIRTASVATWHGLDLALHAVTVGGPEPSTHVLDRIGAQLREAAAGTRPAATFVPIGSASVRPSGEVDGDPIITVVAPDQPGLLAAVCRWLADHDVSIRAARVAGDGVVNDVFIVRGRVDASALERYLSAPAAPRWRWLQRRKAINDQIASTTPNGHAPDTKP